MANNEVPQKKACAVLIDFNIESIELIQKKISERFTDYDISSHNSVCEFITSSQNANYVIIDPFAIESLRAKPEEKKEIIKIAKSAGCGNVELFFSCQKTTGLSQAERMVRFSGAIDTITALKDYLSEDQIREILQKNYSYATN